MPNFKIESWNPVIPENAVFPFPVLYIKPTNGLLEYAKQNKFTILVTVMNSNSVYDNKPMIAVLDSSAYFPNSRINFYNKYGFYTLSLVANWIGYPPENGTVQIDFIDVNSIPKPEFKAPKPIEWVEWYNKDSTVNSKSFKDMDLTKIYIGLIFLVVLSISFIK
jgi:hypothetical protein